ncbi:hypothetical protein QFC21_000517 [Naganishia friedmannii]|uniref:Uncharacterized protein n=1 Tax=Naganishia friedmannii TaxID=89922 RepID=A0ACC2WCS8_9TREE|nr:hypothetical protein QFC21_000517 [Naganishia friedmannii]
MVVSTNRTPRKPRLTVSHPGGGHGKPHHPYHAARWLSLPGFGIFLAFVVAICLWLDGIGPRFYHFQPTKLAEIVTHSLEQQKMQNSTDTYALVEDVITRIAEAYPDTRVRTDFRDRDEWMWNNAGGAMGSMFIVHASITEYLIIFGSAVGTEGHTGRHTADDYFHILKGEQRAYEAGALEPEVRVPPFDQHASDVEPGVWELTLSFLCGGKIYPAGSVHHLERGKVKQYRFAEECWALEYAVGWIPPMLPFGLADTVFSTLDFGSFYTTARITAREMVANLLRGKV